MWTKVSICLFLLRIPVSKVLIRPLQGAVIFLVVSNVILTLLWILQCQPIDAAWNTFVTGKCFGRGQLERIIIAQASKTLRHLRIVDICFLALNVPPPRFLCSFACFCLYSLLGLDLKLLCRSLTNGPSHY